MDLPFSRDALLPGMRVRDWVIEDVLSVGRGAIVYRASGARPEDLVAIKEYFPAELAVRTPDQEIGPRTPEDDAALRLGLRRFAHDMNVLMELTQQGRATGLPQVLEVIKANGGVHAVMAFEPGTPLARLLDSGRRFDEPALLRLATTLGEGLARLHEAGIRHGAITPSDVLLDGPRGPVLLGFGSGEESRVDASVEPSPYAPIEHYAPVHPEGPWTDIYALGAVLNHCITGTPPAEVLERKGGDRLAAMPHLPHSPGLLRAIDAAMETIPQRRPQSVDAWLAMFPSSARAAPHRRRRLLPALLAAAAIPAVAAVAWLAADRGQEPAPASAPIAAPAPAAQAAPPSLAPLDQSIDRTAGAAGRIRAMIDDLRSEKAPATALSQLRNLLAKVERDLTDQQTTRNEVAASGNAASAREAARLFGQVDLRVASAELAARRAQIAAYEAMAASKRQAEEQVAVARVAPARPSVSERPQAEPRAEPAGAPLDTGPMANARELLERADHDIRDIQGDYNGLRGRMERSYGRYGDRGDRRTYARSRDIYDAILDLHGLRRRLAKTGNDSKAQRIFQDFAARRDHIEAEIKDLRRSL